MPTHKKYQYFLTFFVEFSVMISGFLQYRFATKLSNAGDFELFSLLKRILGFSLPLFIVGLGVAIPRYLAISHTQKNANSYFSAGLLIVLGSFIGGVLLVALIPKELSLLLFNDSSYYIWILPLLLLTFGYICHSIIYNYFRGNHRWIEANIIQVVNLGIVPIFCFLYTKNLFFIINTMSTFYFLIYIFFIIHLYRKNVLVSFKFIERKYFTDLIKFGFQRLVGDILLGAFFLIPAIIVTHANGIAEGGKLAFALTFINMAGAALGPVSIILLPDVAKLIKENDYLSIATLHKKVTAYSLVFGFLSLILFLLLADVLIPLVFDNHSPEIILFSKVLFFAVVGYSIYILLRSFNDALNSRAYNSLNIFIGFIVFYIIVKQNIWQIGEGETLKVITAFIFGLSLLGILTYVTSSRLIKNLKS